MEEIHRGEGGGLFVVSLWFWSCFARCSSISFYDDFKFENGYYFASELAYLSHLKARPLSLSQLLLRTHLTSILPLPSSHHSNNSFPKISGITHDSSGMVYSSRWALSNKILGEGTRGILLNYLKHWRRGGVEVSKNKIRTDGCHCSFPQLLTVRVAGKYKIYRI